MPFTNQAMSTKQALPFTKQAMPAAVGVKDSYRR